MKKIFESLLLLAGASALFAGCGKETLSEEGFVVPTGKDATEIVIAAGLSQTDTRAAADTDGFAKQANHWVMEVRTSNGTLFTRQERMVPAGTLEQTFSVTLYKNNSYTFQFWADTKGAYNTADLTNVSLTGIVANQDSLDAFCTNRAYQPSEGGNISATLTRPFAQINVQTTDLDSLYKTAISTAAYMEFKPTDITMKAKVPTSYNVKTQTAGADDNLIEFKPGECYSGYKSDGVTVQPKTTYQRHLNPATLFMGYIFASESKTPVDIAFSFKSNGQLIDYSFATVPLQRNYRTNIRGKLMSSRTDIVVTIDPSWTGEYDY